MSSQDWPAAALRDAITAFRSGGDPAACLALLGSPREPQLAIQRALGRARDRFERDGLEDIAFELGRGRARALPRSAPDASAVLRGVRSAYGDTTAAILKARLEPILATLLPGLETTPPVECLVALAGLIACELVSAAPLEIERHSSGGTLERWTTDCGACGGSAGGRGIILCSRCVERARSVTRDDPRDYLRLNPEAFSCEACDGRPAPPCACLEEVTVPDRPRDGQIIEGHRPADSGSVYYHLRLKFGMGS